MKKRQVLLEGNMDYWETKKGKELILLLTKWDSTWLLTLLEGCVEGRARGRPKTAFMDGMKRGGMCQDYQGDGYEEETDWPCFPPTYGLSGRERGV